MNKFQGAILIGLIVYMMHWFGFIPTWMALTSIVGTALTVFDGKRDSFNGFL